MLEDIQARRRRGQGRRVHGKGQDKNSGVKLMGFGHRVYKNYDPRAKLMRGNLQRSAGNWAWKTTRCSSWPRNSKKIALEDDYFVQRQALPERGLLPGIVQRAIGIHAPGC